jgi:hypothetical protein
LLALMPFVSAIQVNISDVCYEGSFNAVYIGFEPGAEPDTVNGTMVIQNECAGGTSVEWEEPIGVSLGDVIDGDVIVGDEFVYVDSVARPDLDSPAVLTFRNVRFAVQPEILVDGDECGFVEGCTGEVWNPVERTFTVNVSGFSNYSLQGLQEFTVYSDTEPELKSRVYQSLDLGNSYRAETFKCIVQIYGQNNVNQFVLVQTNPQRKVPAKFFGNPDTNNPESLGYFPTENGLANVYYDGSSLAGYQDLEYVVQCANNATKLTYEESISTRYSPAGRSLVARGVWLTDGVNAAYLAIGMVLIVFLVLLVLKFVRSL